ncbi:hypothetical protein JOF56_008908 [Kibdelosporangium banguiense]|uniref:Carrier domain-containing protein n=1 Tax=Kibdelosporangium banguiense TaxID=1365924 RepID=A0ABS4TWZ6_9PSEU|nr:phosphopantetheine-binding protein [Kibdelosporangium banguiense]MBP2328523.1 hypothetical protein [Kibdelosporangium banguiense]
MNPGDGEALTELAGQAWRDVLRCPGPSYVDNFFELGGHSVAGARVMSRLQPHIAVRLPLRVLFDHPVFGEFVVAITRLAEQPA